jgi:hypothetical protein
MYLAHQTSTVCYFCLSLQAAVSDALNREDPALVIHNPRMRADQGPLILLVTLIQVSASPCQIIYSPLISILFEKPAYQATAGVPKFFSLFN